MVGYLQDNKVGWGIGWLGAGLHGCLGGRWVKLVCSRSGEIMVFQGNVLDGKSELWSLGDFDAAAIVLLSFENYFWFDATDG